MLAYIELNIIRNKLREISESPYFSNDFNVFLSKLQNLANHLFDNVDTIPDGTIRQCTFFITDAVNFFTGSTSKKIPYEIVYCLENACQNWISNKAIITTALSPQATGFYFKSVNKVFYEFLKEEFGIEFEAELIQISLPEMYRRRPLFNTPLYHELGHFIDFNKGICEIASINYYKHNNFVIPQIDNFNSWEMIKKSNNHGIWLNHCKEYFADLFSAQFIGSSGVDFLDKIAGSHPASFTHPSTINRVAVVSDFLDNIKNPVVDMFNEIIKALHSQGELLSSSLYLPDPSPNIKSSYDNIRPYTITNKSEMHSFINSAWYYLCDQWENKSGVWSGIGKEDIEKTINDLTEKSIRNLMIQEQWNTHVSS